MIHSFENFKNDESVNEQIKSIFFEASSVQSFENSEARHAFFQKWLGLYLSLFPQSTFISVDDSSKKVLGYITCAPDTLKSFETINGVQAIKWIEHYQEYPAHFHINCHQEARGRGVGTKLLESLESYLREKEVRGVHLITSRDAANVSFYQRNNYCEIASENKEAMKLLFLGKRLL